MHALARKAPTHTYTRTHPHGHTHTITCARARTCARTSTGADTYTHTHTHTHTHTRARVHEACTQDVQKLAFVRHLLDQAPQDPRQNPLKRARKVRGTVERELQSWFEIDEVIAGERSREAQLRLHLQLHQWLQPRKRLKRRRIQYYHRLF